MSKFSKKVSAAAYLVNSLIVLGQFELTEEGRRFLEETQVLKWLLRISNDLLREERIDEMKMQDLRVAIREADELALILQ